VLADKVVEGELTLEGAEAEAAERARQREVNWATIRDLFVGAADRLRALAEPGFRRMAADFLKDPDRVADLRATYVRNRVRLEPAEIGAGFAFLGSVHAGMLRPAAEGETDDA
jgi:hypothetical protein